MTTHIESNGNVQGTGVEEDERPDNAEDQFFDTIEGSSSIDGKEKEPAPPNKSNTNGESPVLSTIKKLFGYGVPKASLAPQTSNSDLMDRMTGNDSLKRKASDDLNEAEEEAQEPSGSPEKSASPVQGKKDNRRQKVQGKANVSKKRKVSNSKPAGSSTVKQEPQEPSPTREMPISMMTRPSEPIASDEYIVAEFIKQKETPEGLEILVRWEDYPDEKDWTWETEESLSESVPKMVADWKKKTPEEEVVIEKVEKILGKKKFKGIPHYLVQWEGYPALEDRTWEPCDNLHEDVPEIVEAYEKQKQKGKKR
ncbi:hypothetical protein B0J14DRAFT_220594 [Halenospora varia]|nr:hypothetical protein B0J14DRAFT_220594 [Halenospora varia]